MRRKDESGFDSDLHHLCSDEIARMLRRCRTETPEIDGRRLLGHLIWVLFRFHERSGPQEAADSLERAAMHVLYRADGFSAEEIDEALRPAMQTMIDIVTEKPKRQTDTGPMRRTRWSRGTVVAFPKQHTQHRKDS